MGFAPSGFCCKGFSFERRSFRGSRQVFLTWKMRCGCGHVHWGGTLGLDPLLASACPSQVKTDLVKRPPLIEEGRAFAVCSDTEPLSPKPLPARSQPAVSFLDRQIPREPRKTSHAAQRQPRSITHLFLSGRRLGITLW